MGTVSRDIQQTGSHDVMGEIIVHVLSAYLVFLPPRKQDMSLNCRQWVEKNEWTLLLLLVNVSHGHSCFQGSKNQGLSKVTQMLLYL